MVNKITQVYRHNYTRAEMNKSSVSYFASKQSSTEFEESTKSDQFEDSSTRSHKTYSRDNTDSCDDRDSCNETNTCKPSNKKDKCSSKCAGNICWPVIIFLVIIIIAVACIFMSSWDHSVKTTYAAGLIVFAVLWSLVLWFFCKSHSYAAAWFFLLVIFAVIIFWYIARFIARISVCGCEDHIDPCL